MRDLNRGVILNGLAIQGDGAAIGAENTGEQPNGSGFSGAIGTDQTVNTALFHIQTQASSALKSP